MIFIVFLNLYEIKSTYDAHWLKIFYHNSSNGVYFNNSNDSIFIDTKQKYSILQKIDDSFKYNNKFEFLLEYPELSGYNRWRQNINPINDIEKLGISPANGYEPVQISWNLSIWGGLVKSIYTCSLLDGSVGATTWWFSIGCYYGCWTGEKFPGPNSIEVTQVYLWIRIKDFDPFQKISCKYPFLRSSSFLINTFKILILNFLN